MTRPRDFGRVGLSSNPTATELFDRYQADVERTDRLGGEIEPVLMGLFGEVGSLLSTVKKLHREGPAYVRYRKSVLEEFGDVLWYFVALCRRLGCRPGQLGLGRPGSTQRRRSAVGENSELMALGQVCGGLLQADGVARDPVGSLVTFLRAYMAAVYWAGLTLEEIAEANVQKVVSRFIEPDFAKLEDFDAGFAQEERLPDHFEIHIVQRNSGQTYLRWNGVFIGDPLTDNIGDNDGYRFHDVFHLAHAAILHWSPTFRSLIKQKRKSDDRYDEEEDSGRAIVVEEGLTAWMFSCAKELSFFEGQNRVSFGLLKTVAEFVRGYEVERCPLSLWERAILQGYGVFREVLRAQGGIVVGNRFERTLTYRPKEDG